MLSNEVQNQESLNLVMEKLNSGQAVEFTGEELGCINENINNPELTKAVVEAISVNGNEQLAGILFENIQINKDPASVVYRTLSNSSKASKQILTDALFLQMVENSECTIENMITNQRLPSVISIVLKNLSEDKKRTLIDAFTPKVIEKAESIIYKSNSYSAARVLVCVAAYTRNDKLINLLAENVNKFKVASEINGALGEYPKNQRQALAEGLAPKVDLETFKPYNPASPILIAHLACLTGNESLTNELTAKIDEGNYDFARGIGLAVATDDNGQLFNLLINNIHKRYVAKGVLSSVGITGYRKLADKLSENIDDIAEVVSSVLDEDLNKHKHTLANALLSNPETRNKVMNFANSEKVTEEVKGIFNEELVKIQKQEEEVIEEKVQEGFRNLFAELNKNSPQALTPEVTQDTLGDDGQGAHAQVCYNKEGRKAWKQRGGVAAVL